MLIPQSGLRIPAQAAFSEVGATVSSDIDLSLSGISGLSDGTTYHMFMSVNPSNIETNQRHFYNVTVSAGNAHQIRTSNADIMNFNIKDFKNIADDFAHLNNARVSWLLTCSTAENPAFRLMVKRGTSAWAQEDQGTTVGTNFADQFITAMHVLHNGSGNSTCQGTWYRFALWPAGNTFFDGGDSGVQNNFIKDNGGHELEDPSFARSAYGTPLVDFNGAASRWNSGAHDGSLGSFSVTGSPFS